ncbi:MAG: response regulator transcription factor [Chloroflexota bacterium]
MKALKSDFNYVKTGDITLDIDTQRTWKGDQELHLTKREFDVLLYLAQRSGEIVRNTELLDAIWGTDQVIGDDALRTVIKRIRKKLGGTQSKSTYVNTVWGRGYVIKS